MQQDMCFETSHSGEFLVTHRTGGVLPIVGTLMKCQVEFNIKRLGALVTSVWLFGEKRQEATETQSFRSRATHTAPGATVRTACPARRPDRTKVSQRTAARLCGRDPCQRRLPVRVSGCRMQDAGCSLRGNDREPRTAAIRPFLSGQLHCCQPHHFKQNG